MGDNTEVEKKEDGKKKLSCMEHGPGPAYLLPTLVGYEKHDNTKMRMPAYSITSRHGGDTLGNSSPGPAYSIEFGLTARGPYRAPAYSITGRGNEKATRAGPGPGSYLYDINVIKQRLPAYTLTGRGKYGLLNSSSPGPVYMLPTTIGPKIPDKFANGQAVITGRNQQNPNLHVPPPYYDIGSPNLVKPASGAVTLKGRHLAANKPYDAGPASYNIYGLIEKVRSAPPKYSLGIRHSPCTAPLITKCDTQEESGITC